MGKNILINSVIKEYVLEIVLRDYRKHIYKCVFVQEIVLKEETI